MICSSQTCLQTNCVICNVSEHLCTEPLEGMSRGVHALGKSQKRVSQWGLSK
jgi:hypothetical protein